MREPRATYRVQLHPGFRFEDAADLTEYVADLGVSHLYASPSLQATAGSTHGYDVVDHSRPNEELGGATGHARLVSALRRRGLGQVLDIVPNHMAIGGTENRWWWDVLENGPSSRYAPYFDVDWDPPEAYLRNLVLLPILGDQYGRVLEAGELRVVREEGSLELRYFDHCLPLSPRSLDVLLASAAGRCGSEELAFIADALAQLPRSHATDRASQTRRYRGKEVLRRQLARLLQERPEVAEAVDTVIEEVNATPDALDTLLSRQNYRLASWKAAARDLGYRRFFGINTLAGIRVEDERVFEESHQLILRWVHDGAVDGLRVDHPDGLRDPRGYFERLRERAPDAWIVGEKILEPGERLRGDWPIQGTTGYDFMEAAGGLFLDPRGEDPLTELYTRFTGESDDWEELVREGKSLVMQVELGSDINRLSALFLDVCEHHRRYRDHTRHDVTEAIRAVIEHFPVYRSYVRSGTGEVTDDDVQVVTIAVEEAGSRRPDIDRRLLDFLRDILLLRVRGELEDELAMRFQQVTGPVMAKGVEDTAMYRFNRLISLNEVGGAPGVWGHGPDAFHRWAVEAAQHRPLGMLSSSTHDTKRHEDVRLRLHVLSEVAGAWREAVDRWAAAAERHRRGGMPDRNMEYLLYQTLVGAWPIDAGRASQYMEKAAREAKVHTSWTAPDEAYESALKRFIEGVLGDRTIRDDIATFAGRIEEAGRLNSLAFTLVKLTAPGVPDIYQGTELWDLSLVDPDNRRPVDFALRRRLLSEIGGSTPERAMARMDEGMPKLWVIQRALHLRRRRPALFGATGSYRPIVAQGAASAHVLAFLRGDAALTVVPRLTLALQERGGWRDTEIELPAGHWRNELTGELLRGGRAVAMSELFTRFPVALLTAEAGIQ